MTTTNPTTCDLREEIECLHSTLDSSFGRALLGAAIFDDLKDIYGDIDKRSAARGILAALVVIANRLGEILNADADADAEGEPDSFDDAPEDTAAEGVRLLMAQMNLTDGQRSFVEAVLKTLL